MYKLTITLLVIGLMMLTLLNTTTVISLHNYVAYAHTFSQNENALFITLIHQIQTQAQIVENSFPTNANMQTSL
jgi:hypothetical protein